MAVAAALLSGGPAAAQEPAAEPQPLPTFAELQAAGARIGEIRIVANNIFDTSDPRENKALYRAANALHIPTLASTVRRALLFSSGEPVSVALIEETERLLRSERYLYSARIRPVAVRDGVVDIEVDTRDTWTLYPTVWVSRSGGENKSEFGVTELNLLGTGSKLSLGSYKDVDRDGRRVEFSNENAFGRWIALDLGAARNSDGSQELVSIKRPFYALDAHWAAGASYSHDDKLEPVYNAGDLVAEYRRRQQLAEVFGGWSRGRVNGWVQRYSLGVSFEDDQYALEPGRAMPANLPPDERLVGPFLRYQLIEDRFVELQNRNQMGRPEYFALGLNAQVQLGWASRDFGSSQDALLYSAKVSRGFAPFASHTFVAEASVKGRYADSEIQRQQLGVRTQYFLPHHRRWTFYAALGGDLLTNPAPSDVLYLGGDNGLRGYPLRYQSGTQRALLTVEERLYTGAFPWRLFRVGAAAYVDVGRAWGGPNVNAINGGWLVDVGVGLRLFSVRTAESNVVHIDVAVPLNRAGDVEGVQFLLSGKSRF